MSHAPATPHPAHPAPPSCVPASMTPDEKLAFAARFPVHVGVDTGKSLHKLVACGPDRVRTKALRVDVSRESFDAADRFLVDMFGVPREQVLIGVEFAGHHGVTRSPSTSASGGTPSSPCCPR